MKTLAIQDLHINPAWIEESKKDIDLICKTAEQEKVDCMTIAGDFFDKPVMASDKSNWNDILQLARQLQSAAQVYFIYGTPSHDSPGSYSSFIDIGWKEITIGKSEKIGDLLIMGMPEITPAFLMAKFPEMSKQEIIEQQYKLVDQVINDYYVPLSKTHDGNVLFMGHGHVAGAKFKADQKPRSSEFMLSESSLSKIDADWYQMGHIHLQQYFNTISGSYGGASHLTWGDTGFKAGFGVIDFTNGATVKRFNYDKPERQKVSISNVEDIENLYEEKNREFYTGVDLWIDIKCNKEFADQFDVNGSLAEIKSKISLGSLSKITLNIQHEEHTRVDTEEYEKAKTEEDLYKIYNPEASESIIKKVNKMESEVESEKGSIKKHTFQFLDLYLKGSKAGLENGVEEIRVDWEEFQNGINLLTGANGTGKSFILGFCNPFSEHLPTGSDLKSLFELKDSQIIRRFRDGKNIITQKIVIDPTLANPTAKYYMDINGEPVANVTGNKKPFDEAVSDIFGSIKMFMACTFRGQKDNPNYPSLEKAKESDLRNIYTELAGINKSEFKKYAHDKAVELKREIELDSREIETLESLLIDLFDIEHRIIDTDFDIEAKDKEIVKQESLKESLNNEIVKIDNLIKSNDRVKEQIEVLKLKGISLLEDINYKRHDLEICQGKINNSESTKTELEELKAKQSQHIEASKKYFKATDGYNKSVNEWMENKEVINQKLEGIQEKAEKIKTEISQFETEKNNFEYDIKELKLVIEHNNKPCEHCGKLPSLSEGLIKESKNDINEIGLKIGDLVVILNDKNKQLEKLRSEYAELKSTIGEKPKEPEEIKTLSFEMKRLEVDESKIKELQDTIDNLKETENSITKLEAEIKNAELNIKSLNLDIVNISRKLVEIDTEDLRTKKLRLKSIESDIETLKSERGNLITNMTILENYIKEDKERREKIKVIKSKVSEVQKDITEWEELIIAYSPKGIEALELSLIVPLIDRKANELLNLNNSRFRVETITQDMDSKGKNLLERFKILVHDSMSNEVKELPVLSGGQLVWVTSALREAIAVTAGQKYGRVFDYKILDEADAALDSDIIGAYYDMMGRLNENKKVVCVSHNSETKNSIENIKDIKDFMVKGE